QWRKKSIWREGYATLFYVSAVPCWIYTLGTEAPGHSSCYYTDHNPGRPQRMNMDLPGNSLDVMEVSPAVRDALVHNKPVVGFETTVLSFGLSFPANLNMAQSVERMVREQGCCPATMGVM